MDNKQLTQYLNEIIDAAKNMQKNLENIDILRFYAGELSILSRAITAILIKTK